MQLTECTNPTELMQWCLANPNIENDRSMMALIIASGSNEKDIDSWISDNLDWLKEHITIVGENGASIEFFIGDWRWIATTYDNYYRKLDVIAEQRGSWGRCGGTK